MEIDYPEMKVGDYIWYKSWAGGEYTVEVTNLQEDYVTCDHIVPEHKGKIFHWFFVPVEITGMQASDLLGWLSRGNAKHFPQGEPDWEI